VRPLAGVIVLAAGLRFGTLDANGFWGDEISTVSLVHMPYPDMLAGVARLESTPPLYYSLAWLWAKLFGTTEVGLRSLSAVLGVGTVPVAYLAARELVSRRAALMAATLVAVSPVLVWFSAEARSYALLVFLATVALWLFGRALRTSSVASLTLWAVASALAVTTHYFAVFLAAPQALLLVRRAHRRRSAVAAAGVIAASAATLPLALHQASFGHAGWIGHTALAGRVATLPGDLTVGFDARPRALLAAAAALAVAAGAALAYRHAGGHERAGAATLGALALAALAAPTALALAGADYLDGRNSLAAAIPLVIAVGVGFTAGGRAGRIAAAGLVALSLAVIVSGAGQPKFHSENWRAAAEDLGASNGVRAIVATPGQAGRKPLDYYLSGTPLPWRRDALVREVDVVALPRQGQSRVEPAYLARLLRLRLPHFRLVRRHLEQGFALLAYRAPRATPVSQAMLDARVKRGAATVLSMPRPSRARTTHTASPAVKS
jgi:hypothetical protein